MNARTKSLQSTAASKAIVAIPTFPSYAPLYALGIFPLPMHNVQ